MMVRLSPWAAFPAPQCLHSLFPLPCWATVAASAGHAFSQCGRKRTIVFSPSSVTHLHGALIKVFSNLKNDRGKKWRRKGRVREETQIHGILLKQELHFCIFCHVWAQATTMVAVISWCSYKFVVLFLHPRFRRAPNHCFFPQLLQKLCFHHSFDL